jgi:hypothetical protein
MVGYIFFVGDFNCTFDLVSMASQVEQQYSGHLFFLDKYM